LSITQPFYLMDISHLALYRKAFLGEHCAWS